MVNTFGRILMVEDDPKDVELTLTALEEYKLANEVVVARDGEEALDYLHCRGRFKERPNDNPAVLLLESETAQGRWAGGAEADQVG